MVQSITEKEKKAKYRAKASEYLDRSEKVQEIVTREKELGRYQEHYKIEANSEVHIILDIIDVFKTDSNAGPWFKRALWEVS